MEVGLLHVIIHVNGFGYHVHSPLTTIEKLPAIGNVIKLYLSERIREDEHEIYGFYSKPEREFFETLIERVSGIGPRLALTIMSSLSISTLKSAIATRDTALLTQCHGIGKKTAERIVIELADKIDALPAHISVNTRVDSQLSSFSQDAVAALISLGYKSTEADKAIRQALNVLGESASAEELIKHALHS